MGTPPSCRPECVLSSECPSDRACINQKCSDPCSGACGFNARCRVQNHSPLCICDVGYVGNPFTRCSLEPPLQADPPPQDPCYPSPCGPNAQCRNANGAPSCSCLPTYMGTPPNCRPECIIHQECISNRACINQKCTDPCPGSCGLNARCDVLNHIPVCTCFENYSGDPFSNCQPAPPVVQDVSVDPCNPTPCGPNAQCTGNGVCTCLAEFQGDPYRDCRPECVLNSDCARNKACLARKCRDPCPGTCAPSAICEVLNHVPMCSCPAGTVGQAFVDCRVQAADPQRPQNSCNPSPCGPNSQCRQQNEQAICSCVPGFIGAPPTCRPECVLSSDCLPSQACHNQKCRDPCAGTCGIGAVCRVVNHSPICTCPAQYKGNPFMRCEPNIERPVVQTPIDPCYPSPCGPNAQCRVVGDSPTCTCLPEYIGASPNCRPECTSHQECANHLACVNRRCVDPCPGACGANADCRAVSHSPNCFCAVGFVGDPFYQCSPVRDMRFEEALRPCQPSPCGTNAVCHEQNGAGSCRCLPKYLGNPYEQCRPECVIDSDCVANRACTQNRCQDPCSGFCGEQADCQVINHRPTCTCRVGYIGNPYQNCHYRPEDRKLNKKWS